MVSRRYWLSLLLFVLGLTLMPALGWGQPTIISEFEVDADGWGVSGGAIYHHATLGNPGGFIEFEDNFDGAGYFSPPARFLGDLSQYDQGSLSFDLKCTVSNNNTFFSAFGLVGIYSGGTNVQLDIVPDIWLDEWTAVTIPLTAATWGIGESEWQALLADVTEIRITMDSQWDYYDRTGIDNVCIAPVPTAAAPGSFGAIKALY